jgi:uncharacterized membrane protein
MKDALHIIAIWTHILGIALYVGPQFFLAFAWVPASRGIADQQSRLRTMRVITRRFGIIGGIGLALILIAGGYLIADWRNFYAIPSDTGFNDLRFGIIFSVKMLLLVVMLIIVGIHTWKVGPKLMDTLQAQADGKPVTEAELRSARMRSMALSVTGLVLVLLIMVCGTMLTTTSFSLRST